MTNPSSTTAGKLTRRRHDAAEHYHHHSLLPGLPDDIARLCLSLVPPQTLYSVCRSWRRLIYSPSYPPFLSLYAVVLPPGQTLDHTSEPLQLISFDPISSEWRLLPPPPPRRFLFRHRSYISRKLPIQSVVVSGKLVLLAATDDRFLPALKQPLVFDPVSGDWEHGPEFATPRRWCAAGAARGDVYVASGFGARYNEDVARSIERWDLTTTGSSRGVVRIYGPLPNRAQDRTRPTLSPPMVGCRGHRAEWRRMADMKDGRFCREAIEAVGWRGKLCMVNVKGDAAKEGAIYDVETDEWAEMPPGMLAGWKGPAAAMEEESLYVVDESKGLLKRYEGVRDEWVVVAESGLFIGAQQLSAEGGRVCVLCEDGVRIAVVDVVAAAARVWVVDVPIGIQVVGIHVLPRSLINSGYNM